MIMFVREIAGHELSLIVGVRYRAESAELFGHHGVRIHRWDDRAEDWDPFPVLRVEGMDREAARILVVEFNREDRCAGRIWPDRAESAKARQILADEPPAPSYRDQVTRRKVSAVKQLASLCTRNHLDPGSVLRRMKRPEQYDFNSEAGAVGFALDAGAAVEIALTERRGRVPRPVEHGAALAG